MRGVAVRLAVGVAAVWIVVPASADVSTTTTTSTDTTTTETASTTTSTAATTTTEPATTTTLAPVEYTTVRLVATPYPASRPRRKKHKLHQPLKVTPPLGQKGYVFPVAGPSEFGDTYGALRTDVRSHWHHGDDIFAALGTPVVAVASGTVNRAGWADLGGWRLWVRDRLGNEFYYAHLSGYAPAIVHSSVVRAGEVVGFVGNTGDAISTSPHLHFEIHPRSLLHLQYDGAVDPTRYLDGWTHVRVVHAPHPVDLRLPAGASGREARRVFRELLAARHLLRHPRQRMIPRHLAHHVQAIVAARAVPAPPPPGRVSPLAIALLMGLGSLGGYGVCRQARRSGALRHRFLRTYSVLVSVGSAIAREVWTPETERTLTLDGAAPQPDATPTPTAID
jgi:murein DD-endopeptidase MepM/ murein hydrolase activator NlpD